MNVDGSLLSKLEKLGMIEIDAHKKESIKKDLEDILTFVDNISDLNLEFSDENSSSATPLRDDNPSTDPSISNNILKNAPNAKDNYFIVPKIIE